MGNSNLNHELLHWVTLAMILDFLVDYYGYDELAEMVRINCFASNPTKTSCLTFLRKTEWARLQVQWLYVRTKKEEMRKK